jgi:hypothetical protein
MVRLRILLPFLALPCAAQWTQPQKEWALATSAVLNQVNQGRHDLLATGELNPNLVAASRQLLGRAWKIHSRAELLAELDSLSHADSDPESVGWYLTRAVLVARWGYAAGYINEAEAWKYIMPVAQRIQRTFSSWQELGDAYLAGRFAWNPDVEDNRSFEYAYRVLLMDPGSPWRKIPWNLDLGDGASIVPSSGNSTEFVIQSHPNGLTCVRVRLLDHGREPGVLPVMEHVLGCQPYVTSDAMDGRDWVLNAECVQPGAVSGTRVTTHLHVEPFADWLRANGFTQVLYYLQHVPAGDSQLQPAAHDSWVGDNLQEYVGRQSLREPFPDWTLTYGLPERTVRVFLGASALFVFAILIAALAVRQQLAQAGPLSPAYAWALQLRYAVWTGWLALSISLQGFTIVGFSMGAEGLAADLRALAWYPLTVFALRLAVEILLTSPVARRFAPSLSTPRLVWMSFWRVATETPFALVLLLLAKSGEPLNFGTVVALIALGGVLALFARFSFRVALDNRGAPALPGEFYYAVFEMAARLKAPLKRLYIVPDSVGTHFAPVFGAKGGMIIPERLVRNLSRPEIDALVAQTLLFIRSGYRRRTPFLVLASVLIGTPLAYAIQLQIRDPDLKLGALTGLVELVGLVVVTYLRIVRSRAQSALAGIPGAPEGWIAAVAHSSRLAGAVLPGALILRMAKRTRLTPQQMLALTNLGLPGEPYPLPGFDSNALVNIT